MSSKRKDRGGKGGRVLEKRERWRRGGREESREGDQSKENQRKR